jgi:predicted acylesterase/phospholipase RssA
MSMTQNQPSIGLCLSGGGFRASFYALGVLRYMAEAGLLARLVAVSAVSGGSIASAAVADRWEDYVAAGGGLDAFVEKVDEPFRSVVTSRNLRRRWMVRSLGALVPFSGGRTGAYSRTLAGNLFTRKRVAELPLKPEFIFTCTDLSKGRAFRFASAYVGSYDYGYVEPAPAGIKLGAAVAASAAFPPSMTVLNLGTRHLSFPKAKPPRTLSLVDGGVYDNLGLEWFQGWTEDSLRPGSATRPDFVIVANASGLLSERDRRFSPVSAFRRDLAVQYQQSLNLRVRWWNADLESDIHTGVYMAIKSDPRSESLPPASTASALPSELIQPLASLRTDLDRFSREEADLLSYHSYWTLHARLTRHAPDLALNGPTWTRFAGMSAADIERMRGALINGSHRFFRRLRGRLRA